VLWPAGIIDRLRLCMRAAFDLPAHEAENFARTLQGNRMSAPPEWLKSFADKAALEMQPADVLAPVGCHFCHVEGTWEVSLFASSTEVVGGKQDGLLRFSRFRMDLRALMDLFSEVEDVSWQALPMGPEDELGAHVAVGGTYAGNRVWLRILAQPPRRFSHGRRAISYEPAWEETW